MSTCIHTWFICVHKWFICFHMWNHICSCVYINENWGNMYIYYHMCSYISIHGHMCSLTKIEVIFTCMITYDHIWTHMIIYESYMAAYGHVWHRMTSYMSINEFIHVHKWMHICWFLTGLLNFLLDSHCSKVLWIDSQTTSE